MYSKHHPRVRSFSPVIFLSAAAWLRRLYLHSVYFCHHSPVIVVVLLFFLLLLIVVVLGFFLFTLFVLFLFFFVECVVK